MFSSDLPGPRSSSVAGLFMATLVATFTNPSVGLCSDFLQPKYMFNDPLLVDDMIANFEPTPTTLLFDSGASVHCCPLDFASEWPLLPLHGLTPNLKTVSGSPIQTYGKRFVGLKLNGHICYLQFYVCDVHISVVSVSRLISQGFSTYLSKKSMTLTSPTGVEIQIHRTGPMFYLYPDILPYNSRTFDSICIGMTNQMQMAVVNLSPSKDMTSLEQAPKKPTFYHADRWTLEGNTLTRIHKRPRKTLFVPTGTKDMPVESDKQIGRAHV